MKRLLILPLVAFTACTTVCNIESTVTLGVSSAVVSALKCKNSAAVQESISGAIKGLGLCKSESSGNRSLTKGSIADSVCPLAANVIVSLVGKQVPTKWECDTTNAESVVADIVTTACKALPL